jgi:hypothetical protein
MILLRLIATGAMEQHIFAYSLIIEGTTEKVLQFMPLQTKLWFRRTKKCIFKHYREFQTIKTLLIDITLAMKIFFW